MGRCSACGSCGVDGFGLITRRNASKRTPCLRQLVNPAMLNRMTTNFLRLAFRSSLGLIAAAFFASTLNAADHPDTSGWTELFAADLTKANDAQHWSFAEGVLVAKDHVTLWTKDSYSNFILDLEFKVAKESNSGVFLRSGDTKNVLAALEIQVHDSTDGSKYGMLGAIYDAMPPSKEAAKPVGEWNHYTITCQDNLVTVVLNGEEIIKADLNNWPEVKKNPDGTPNKFPVALKDFARKGPIGLQGLHGKAQAPVWYRNLKIKVLE